MPISLNIGLNYPFLIEYKTWIIFAAVFCYVKLSRKIYFSNNVYCKSFGKHELKAMVIYLPSTSDDKWLSESWELQ